VQAGEPHREGGDAVRLRHAAPRREEVRARRAAPLADRQVERDEQVESISDSFTA
jgi:hypothetical protein